MANDATTREIISRKEAISRGLSKYFTGRICKHGHLSERYVSGWICRGCSDQGAIDWRAKNPERWKASKIAYKEKHKDFLREWARGWREQNADLVRQHRRNSKAKRKNAVGKHTAADIVSILKAQKGRCAYCREKLKKYHVDHIKALARGGTNFRYNIQIACEPCNLAKGTKDPIDFARSLGRLL